MFSFDMIWYEVLEAEITWKHQDPQKTSSELMWPKISVSSFELK